MAEDYYVTENDSTEDWNDDMIEEMTRQAESPDFSSLVVWSRDWTVQTIHSQIEQGNIDLNPKFQRRNAWNDDKKTRLIESLIVGLPVPEIVLAEHPQKKRAFIIIDGKQRLLTIAGFINPEKFDYWDNPKLGKQLSVRTDLQGVTFDQMQTDSTYEEEERAFLNADVRCTVVSNYQSSDILYNIFYRLNTGSVPLSSQELRQVLNKGPFADYLMEITTDLQPIHKVLKLNESDPRMRDVEIILRFICFVLFSQNYKGNLRKFLDDTMGDVTKKWEEYNELVKQVYSDFNKAIERLQPVFGKSEIIGRKYTDGKGWERLNKALFEVEVYYFMQLDDEAINGKRKFFVEEFKKFCGRNERFRESIRTSTSDLEKYAIRYKLFCDFINSTLGTDLSMLPLNYDRSDK